MKWPHKFTDQLELMENLDHLFKMKLESGCGKEKAIKWIREMFDLYYTEGGGR